MLAVTLCLLTSCGKVNDFGLATSETRDGVSWLNREGVNRLYRLIETSSEVERDTLDSKVNSYISEVLYNRACVVKTVRIRDQDGISMVFVELCKPNLDSCSIQYMAVFSRQVPNVEWTLVGVYLWAVE